MFYSDTLYEIAFMNYAFLYRNIRQVDMLDRMHDLHVHTFIKSITLSLIGHALLEQYFLTIIICTIP